MRYTRPWAPLPTIVANVLAIMSFTLNSVYTNGTAIGLIYDHIIKRRMLINGFMAGEYFWSPFSVVVDDIFDIIFRARELKQPILPQYCDGRKVRCGFGCTQWGSARSEKRGIGPIEDPAEFFMEMICISIRRTDLRHPGIAGRDMICRLVPSVKRCGSCRRSS